MKLTKSICLALAIVLAGSTSLLAQATKKTPAKKVTTTTPKPATTTTAAPADQAAPSAAGDAAAAPSGDAVPQASPTPNRIEWKERDEFHKVMSGTFHPMEKGDMDPIRARADELAKAAKTWLAAPLPKEIKDKEEVKATLTDLTSATAALAASIKGKMTDDAIRDQLTKIHEIFHTIVEKCRPEEEQK